MGSPGYYLGDDVIDLDEQWEKEYMTHGLSAQTYIQNCIPNVTKMIGIEQFAKKKNWMNLHYVPRTNLPI